MAENDGDKILQDKVNLQVLSLRSVRGFTTTSRRIGMTKTYSEGGKKCSTSVPRIVAEREINNRANTTVLGGHMTVNSFTGESSDVQGFKESMPVEKNVPIASAVTAYDDPKTGETRILEFHQGLWFGDTMKHSLINPNQCRITGIDRQREENFTIMTAFTQQVNGILQDKNCQIVNAGDYPF